MLARLIVVLVLCQGSPAHATEPPGAAAERVEIRRERAAVESRYKQGEIACRDRFAVTDCVNELQAQRRESLSVLLKREIELDEAKRKAEAAENSRHLDAKRAAAASRPPPVPRAEPAKSASAPATAGRSASAPGERARTSSKTADDPAQAAERVAAQQRRASEAAAHRAQVEQRNAERAARGKKSTPLPVPVPLPPAGAASS